MSKKIFSVIIAFVIWQIMAGIINPIFLPSPYQVIVQFVDLARGKIVLDILFTLARLCVAVVFGIIIGVPIGLLMGYYTKLYQVLEVFIDFFRSLPATSLFPLFLLFFGIGNLSQIFIGVWSSSLILLINSMYGARRAKRLRFKTAKVIGLRGIKFIRKIIFFEALPEIFTGIRVAISLSLAIMIVVEMFIGTQFGLGQRIYNAQAIYNTPEVYAVILLTGMLGYSLNKCFVIFEDRVLHWRGK